MSSSQDITLSPPLSRISSQLSRSGYAALCGANNSGKSLILKHLKKTIGLTAYMVGPQRFYHIYHIGTQLRQANEYQQFENNFNTQFNDKTHNHEMNYIDLGRIISSMNNSRRDELFKICGQLLGCKFSMNLVEPDNDLSMRYIDMDGQNISVGSTGTRLLMTLIGLCMDERIGTILIDEPELGLGPKIQYALATLFANRTEREKYFPQLNGIIVATHSHLLLDRNDIHNNFVVRRNLNQVQVEQVASFGELNNLQFNLLGNSFEPMFLPSAFVLVEGKTDRPYIEKCISIRHSERKIVVVECQGDIKKQLHSLRIALGEIAKSPYRSRIFAVLDSVHNKSEPAALENMGMVKENIVVWEKNGIEFLYPPSIITKQFGCSEERLSELIITGDQITMNGISIKKSELSDVVLKEMTSVTPIPEEIDRKLLIPLYSAIG